MNATAEIVKLEKLNVDDLKERKGDLDKAITGLKYDRVIIILKYLKKIEMTKEILALTLIGKTMSTLS